MVDRIRKYYKDNGLKKTIKWLVRKPADIINKKINTYKCINYKGGNILDRSKISKKRVFIFAGVPYFDIGGGQRSSQLTKTFNKIGYDVIYIYSVPTSESKIYKLDIPTVIHKYIKKFSISEFDSLINKNDLVIFEVPNELYIPYLELSYNKNAKIVYENIDNWETLGSEFFDKKVLKKFLLMSNVLTATAVPLKKQTLNYLKEFRIKNKEVIYLANAVNDEMFDPNKEYNKPNDLILGSKTFLYYGSLWGSWFDWEFVKYISNLDKEYKIYLIGDDKNIGHIKEELNDNVYFLGLKKQSELPSYLKYVDYGILPFKSDTIGMYVSPLKIFEYISMNKIVISSKLPDIKGYPNTYFVDNLNDIKKIVDKSEVVNIDKRNDFIKNNNWVNRCEVIIKKVRSK